MCLFLCVSACVGPQVSTAARAEAEVHAWACHLSDLARKQRRSSAHVVADSLAASVQTTALNVPLLPPPPPPLLGLKTVLGGQILAERESRGITEGVLCVGVLPAVF